MKINDVRVFYADVDWCAARDAEELHYQREELGAACEKLPEALRSKTGWYWGGNVEGITVDGGPFNTYEEAQADIAAIARSPGPDDIRWQEIKVFIAGKAEFIEQRGLVEYLCVLYSWAEDEELKDDRTPINRMVMKEILEELDDCDELSRRIRDYLWLNGFKDLPEARAAGWGDTRPLRVPLDHSHKTKH
jgi:hypothetical protein